MQVEGIPIHVFRALVTKMACMHAIMVMFDTLCRRFLPPYGNDWVIAPNFRRLAERTVQFQNAYVGSMPCMPARREIHTGRYNFLHRSWGPLEPFDDSMPELLSRAGIHTHKVTDHYHYWEDGGATYHNRYTTFDFVRGQEGDAWHGWAGPVDPGDCRNRGGPKTKASHGDMLTQDWINRGRITCEAEMPQTLTFDLGMEHIRRNARFDNWFCQIETFDPHEPFFTQKEWQQLYPHDWTGGTWDWPGYERVSEDRKSVEHMKFMYAALVSMCDRNLGRILDLMDELDLWQNTMLIVNTDHGFLMGEHDWWAKCRMPFWQEIAHIPLWIWDPRSGRRGVTREALVQTMDLAPTLLDFFAQPIPPDMLGKPLRATIDSDASVRKAALYGIHGGHVNVTDGRHVYMRGPVPANAPLNQYTHMATHMKSRFSVNELQQWEKHPGFAFTKGCPVMQIPCNTGGVAKSWMRELESKLYDLQSDYGQTRPLTDTDLEREMTTLLVEGMVAAEAPPEQYTRLGLPRPS